MSIQAVAWALDQDLPARPKLVLVSVANHADHRTGYCWLKAETIADEAACTKRSVYRFIGGLIRNGYLRRELKRGDDGKQRANDYWILLDRQEKKWDWGANLADGDEAEVADELSGEDEPPQDVVEPSALISPGEIVENSDDQPVEKHAVSLGPGDSTFTHNDIAEPSKSKSKESSGRPHAATPRGYHPPPPKPMGEVFDNAKQIFAFEHTPAYDQWAVVMARRRGIRHWHLTTKKLVDGQWKSGWYFPTLFPPQHEFQGISTGPPKTLATEDDLQEFSNSMRK